MKTILIIAETDGNSPKPVTFELSSLARRMDGQAGENVLVLVVGVSPDEAAQTIAAETGLDVLALAVSGTEWITGDIRKQVAAQVAETLNPRYILCAHSAEGSDYAPALAIRLGAACVSAVNRVTDDGQGDFVFSRSICGGQFNALVKPDTDQAVIMVQPGLMQPQNFSGPSGEIRRETLAVESGKVRMIGVEKTRESSSKLGQASVIVAAGRGIGAPENLESIRRFAALFPNSAVAGSRPLIDMGWLEYRYQVGITGATVAPPVYIACGISGSTQHIAGMNGSAYVVSINSDPCAAIFNVSDLCIVDDILGFIDAFERYVNGE